MANRILGVEHFWAAEANYAAVEEMEGYPVRPFPLVFQAPVTTLVAEGNPILLHRYARKVTANCELCFVVAKAAQNVPQEQAAEYVREYRVLAAFRDYSTIDYLGQEAPARETSQWETRLSRWADSMHALSTASLPANGGASPYAAAMCLSIDGVGEVVANAADYLHQAAAIISFLSRAITLQPGDVISLGRAGDVVAIPVDLRLPEGMQVRASIEGVGELTTPILDMRVPRQVKPPTFWWL